MIRCASVCLSLSLCSQRARARAREGGAAWRGATGVLWAAPRLASPRAPALGALLGVRCTHEAEPGVAAARMASAAAVERAVARGWCLAMSNATFKVTLSMKKEPHGGPVYCKMDGQRFKQAKTVKLHTDTTYRIDVSFKPPRMLE